MASIFSVSDDNTIKKWDVKNDGALVHQKTFSGHARNVGSILLSNSQYPTREIVTCDFDGMLKSWNIETGENTDTFKCDSQTFRVAWWKKEQYLIVSGYDTLFDIHILQWNKVADNSERGKIIRTLKGHADTVRGLIVDEESNQLLSCSDDKTIRLWDLSTGKQMKQFNHHADWVHAMCKLNKNLFVSAGADGNIGFWDIASGEYIQKIYKAHDNWIRSLLYSESEQVLISVGDGKVNKVWSLKFDATRIQECDLRFEIVSPVDSSCFSMAFLDGVNNGSQVIFGCVDGSMFTFDLKTRVIMSVIPKAHLKCVNEVAILHEPKLSIFHTKLRYMQQAKILTNIIIKCFDKIK